MAISFPLDMPSSPGIRNITWKAAGNTAFTQSEFSKLRQYFQWPGDLLSAVIELPKMTRAQAAAWIGWGAAMRGRAGSFYLQPLKPERTPLGVATGTCLIDGAGQTGSSINTKGWTASQTPIIKAGSWISFGNVTERLYMITRDANSDGAGKALLELYPRVREATTADDAISREGATGVFRLDSDSFEWNIEPIMIYGLKFTAVEAI